MVLKFYQTLGCKDERQFVRRGQIPASSCLSTFNCHSVRRSPMEKSQELVFLVTLTHMNVHLIQESETCTISKNIRLFNCNISHHPDSLWKYAFQVSAKCIGLVRYVPYCYSTSLIFNVRLLLFRFELQQLRSGSHTRIWQRWRLGNWQWHACPWWCADYSQYNGPKKQWRFQ